MQTFGFPTNLEQAETVLRKICKLYGVKVYFNDKFGNFSGDYNKSACSDIIECSKYFASYYDLLVFDVLHELGHIVGGKKLKYRKLKNCMPHEIAAWNWAIDAQIKYFRRNPSIRQAEHMIECLGSYIPDYSNLNIDWDNEDVRVERESRFYCLLQKQILH